jgi:hypothetical protein
MLLLFQDETKKKLICKNRELFIETIKETLLGYFLEILMIFKQFLNLVTSGGAFIRYFHFFKLIVLEEFEVQSFVNVSELEISNPIVYQVSVEKDTKHGVKSSAEYLKFQKKFRNLCFSLQNLFFQDPNKGNMLSCHPWHCITRIILSNVRNSKVH